MPMALQFHLASKSPRRQILLRQMKLNFDVINPEVPEQPGAGETPEQYALRIAVDKARAGQAMVSDGLPVLGADTDVVLDGRILGKPRDRKDAIIMLLALSKREHQVYSAVAMVQGERVETTLSVTRVRFGEISAALAQNYWETGEPEGKAGAYAIQGLGASFVKEVIGSYTGVVGLPLFETSALLARFGIRVIG
jgi:septum formation protein